MARGLRALSHAQPDATGLARGRRHSRLETGKGGAGWCQDRTREVRILLDEPGPGAHLAITPGDIQNLARRAGLTAVAHADPSELLMDAYGRRLRDGVERRKAALTAGRR